MDWIAVVSGFAVGAIVVDEIADAIEAVIAAYRRERVAGERFIDSVRHLGVAPLRAAADRVRLATAAHG